MTAPPGLAPVGSPRWNHEQRAKTRRSDVDGGTADPKGRAISYPDPTGDTAARRADRRARATRPTYGQRARPVRLRGPLRRGAVTCPDCGATRALSAVPVGATLVALPCCGIVTRLQEAA
jgi:hypothetical protein